MPDDIAAPPLKEHLETLVQIRTQDLEPDPGGNGLRLRQGVAADRRVSVADAQMRHGRKGKAKASASTGSSATSRRTSIAG